MEDLHHIRMTGSALFLNSKVPNPAGRNPGTRWPQKTRGNPNWPGARGVSCLFQPKSLHPEEARETPHTYTGSLRPSEVIPFLIRKSSAPFFRLLFRAFTLYIWKGVGRKVGEAERRRGKSPNPPSLTQCKLLASSWGWGEESEEVQPPHAPSGWGARAQRSKDPGMPPRPPPRQAGGGLSPEFSKLLPAVSHSPLGGLGSGSGSVAPGQGRAGAMGSRALRSPLHSVQPRWGPRRRHPLLPLLLPLLLLLLPPPPRVGGFNLDAEAPTVLSGPPGSFFGFSVEFYRPGTNG